MSAAPQVNPADGDSVPSGVADRRDNDRFPVREEVRYRVFHPGASEETGCGRTLNISSGGVLFTTEGELPAGGLVELSVNWPAKLDGACRLQLVAVGRVVRAESGTAAVRIDKYEFRTRRAQD